MNIYDEAIENTQVLLALLDITKTPNVSKKFKMLREIENALEHAKKVEELLGLYKKLCDINIQFSIFGCNIEDLKLQQYECLKQIKQLEEELK